MTFLSRLLLYPIGIKSRRKKCNWISFKQWHAEFNFYHSIIGNFSRWQIYICFNFSKKTGFDISCKLRQFAWNVKTCWFLFLCVKNKKNIFIYDLLKILLGILAWAGTRLHMQRLRSACACGQADLNLHCLPQRSFGSLASQEGPVKTDGCAGLSESSGCICGLVRNALPQLRMSILLEYWSGNLLKMSAFGKLCPNT